jgi:predicted lipoprotein with Yx(FWY)xxD motif
MLSNEGTTPFLVDDQGRSLYIYLNDSPHSGASICVDDCAVDWPPLTVEAPPVAGPGVDEFLVGIITRDDGSTQATYNGWPLYYYILDTIPGTTNAPNLNRIWFLVSPAGEPVRR